MSRNVYTFRDLSRLVGVQPLPEADAIGYRIEAEREVRRLGLHRVEDALDLPREELKALVSRLLAESRARQEKLEEELKFALAPWLRS